MRLPGLDDGEPSGTAAQPIRQAIEGANLVDCVVVVTRYKASTAPKLGAGGLIRAYGQAARDCLKTAQPAPAQAPRISCELEVPPASYGAFRGLLSSWEHRGVSFESETFEDDGSATVVCVIDDEDLRASFLREANDAGCADAEAR